MATIKVAIFYFKIKIWKMNYRPEKDRYYLEIAKEVAMRSTCLRRKFGALIVKDDQIVATGYVGACRKTKDCFHWGKCLREELEIPHGQRYELCRSVHSEMNAIINAARAGVRILGGDIYIWGGDANNHPVDTFPCFLCKKMIINAGLKRVICSQANGSYKIYNVFDWVKEWQKNDLIKDQEKYQ